MKTFHFSDLMRPIRRYRASELMQIGENAWSGAGLKNKLGEFSELYKSRPIKDNEYGMKSVHMFLAWFLMQALKPKYIIESGIYKGQGTWLFEKAAPSAMIHSIDINLGQREYISGRVMYHDKDFTRIDWSGISKNETVCFFDDHQNAVKRIRFAEKNGFKKLIFDDNYPLPLYRQGDCYSLKQAFARGGADMCYLKKIIKTYKELPPVFISENTRFGDKWDERYYPTPAPLYYGIENDYLRVYFDEAASYTWMCYVELK